MPVTIGLVAAGTQALVGGIQAATSGAKKRERELEQYAQSSPVYQGSKPIDSYYNEAMRRYQSSPYQTAKFVMGKNLSDRSTAAGLAALNQRGMALPGVSKLVAQGQDNTNRLVAQAEQDRRQDFGTLGAATRMKAQDEMTQFDINQMTPYNRMLALKQMKAQAANDRKNAGLQMLGSGLSNAAMVGMSMPKGEKMNLDTSYTYPTIPTQRNVGYGAAPTSFSGRALNPQMSRTGYGVLQSDKIQPFVMPKII